MLDHSVCQKSIVILRERERERERWCSVFGGTLEEIIDECAPQASSLRIILC